MSTYDDASLILYPSGYKASKAYSLKPTDGSGDLTFTRASTATRVNAEGLIEEASVLGSELVVNGDFSSGSTGWTLESGWSISGGLATHSGTTSNLISSAALVNGKTYVFEFLINSIADGVCNLYDTGSATTYSSYNSVGLKTFTFVKNSSSSIALRSNSTSCTIDNVSVKEVITLNVPRIDYTGGGCGKLLLEKQSTNLVTYSSEFNFWTLSGDGVGQSQTSNYAISPDGTNNATRLQLNKTGGSFSRLSLSTTGTIGGTSIAYTIYLKANIGTSNVYIQAGGNIGSAINVTSEWTRYEIIGNAPGTTTTCSISIADSVSGTSETADILIYGAQLENGSYSTSLINTTSTAVTRLADSASKTGISSLIGQTEGVFYAEFTIPESQSPSFFSISDGTSGNRIIFGYYAGGLKYYANSSTGSFSTNGIIDASPIVGVVYKIAVAYKNNDFVVYKNGTNTNTLTTFTVPSSLTAMDNQGAVGQYIYASVKEILLFPTRLTNDQLADLTGGNKTTFNALAEFYGYTIL